MKLRILQIALFIPAISLFSQDWQLFPYKQTSYYQQGMNVETFTMDSVVKIGEDSVLYFNVQWNKEESDFIPFDNWQKPDSFYVKNDSIIQKDTRDDMDLHTGIVIFKPYSRPGDSWDFTTNKTFKISCIEEKVDTIMGLVDSIKVFSCSPTLPANDLKFILSKHYGFIQYYPFSLFIYDPGYSINYKYKMIGLKNDTLKSGYQQPQFKDYFHLQKGDKLYWKIKSDGFQEKLGFYHEEKYCVDTIVSVVKSDIEVNYSFSRFEFETSGKFIRTYSNPMKNSKKYIGIILESPTSWNSQSSAYTQAINLIISGTDTSSVFNYGHFYIDHSIEFKYSTKHGMIYYASYFSYSGSSYIEELIGSEIKGEKEGFFPAFLDNEIDNTNTIKIYPNPSNGIYRIDRIVVGADLKMIIYDSMGRIVYEKNKFKDNFIDLSEYNSGIYLISITGADINYTGKLILEK